MIKATGILAFVLFIAACATRGAMEVAPPSDKATQHQIWVADFRAVQSPNWKQKLPPRPDKVRYQSTRISVPPDHKVGQIEWPQGKPNAETDFVAIDSRTYKSSSDFAKAIARATTPLSNETLLYVHGYNYTHGEAVYQMAQIAHDFDVPSPSVLFSWPSAAKPLGYLYDRDSVLIARDHLEKVMVALTRQPGRKVTLLGHSMGNLLIMETLRQIEISGSVDVASKISGLIMVSPDIDGELFYTQASRLKTMPTPSVIIAAKQDSILRLSAFLTGRTNRLGSETDRAAVRDLPVLVIDASEFSTRGTNHDIALTSPAAISILKNLRPDSLPGQAADTGLLKITNLR